MGAHDYLAELKRLRKRLLSDVEHVEFKEDGQASFVLAQRGNRAVEASRDGNEWWLEFWDSSREDAPPVRESTVSSVDMVVSEVLEWLEEAPSPAPLTSPQSARRVGESPG